MAKKAATSSRSAAAQRAAQLRAEQERKEKRNRLIIIASLVVALAVVGGLIFWIMSGDRPDPLNDVEEQPEYTSQGAASIGSDGVAGTTNEGVPTLEIYVDYACTFCNQLEQVNSADIEELFSNGEVNLEMRLVNFLDHPLSYNAAHASAVILDAEPDKFWDFHADVFGHWDQLMAGGGDFAALGRLASGVGISDETIARFSSGEFDEYVEAASNRARDYAGVRGTPSVFLDGRELDGNIWQVPGGILSEVRGEDAPDQTDPPEGGPEEDGE